MMGRKDFAPKLFHTLSLSKLVPKGHLVRRLETVLDLGFVRRFCAPFYSPTGQPSVDPVVIFKMLVLGYLYGITSERRLAEECSLHLAFRWYLGYDLDEETPNHSVLSKARRRYGPEVFERFFQEVLGRCLQAGLIGGERLFADSTLIDANASVQSLVDRETTVFRRPEEPGQFVEALFQYDAAEKGLSPAVPGRPNSVAQEVDERKRCWKEKKSKRGRKPSGKRRTNRRQVSTTDPDAAVVARPGMKARLAYKNHFTVDGAHRVITAVRVTSADAEDSTQLAALLDQQPVPARLVCADSHYGVAAVYEDIRRRGMRPVIPRRSSHTQKTKPDRIPLSEFHYDSDEDVYFCPQGRKLKRAAYDARWDRYYYRPKRSDCSDCPVRLACGTETSVRTIVRSPYQDSVEWALELLSRPNGREIMKQRQTTAEWVVAEAKNFHGLRRAQHRGLPRVSIQILLTGAVQNIKRLLGQPFHDLSEGIGDLIRGISKISFSYATAG
jgi:transposase